MKKKINTNRRGGMILQCFPQTTPPCPSPSLHWVTNGTYWGGWSWMTVCLLLQGLTETWAVLPFNRSPGETFPINFSPNLPPFLTTGLILGFFPKILQHDFSSFISTLTHRRPVLCFSTDLMLFSLVFCHMPLYYMSYFYPPT